MPDTLPLPTIQNRLLRPPLSRKPSHSTSVELVSHVKALACSLKPVSGGQLRHEVNLVRRELALGQNPTEPHLLISGLALAMEAVRRTMDITLHDVQLLGAMSMTRRCVVQMQTGDGKSIVTLAAALHLSLAGRGVHVITPNMYLAERDQQLAAKVAGQLGISVALLPEQVDAHAKMPAYDSDITYGTCQEFGCDYLRDQLTLRQQSGKFPGRRPLNNFKGQATFHRITMQRGLAFCVVDEADSVLVDDADSPLVLSVSSGEPSRDADAYVTAKALAELLEPAVDYVLEPSAGRVALTEAGILRCHADDVAIPVLQLVRPWTEYVQQALRARCLFRRGLHYLRQHDEVRIVDETTGRMFDNRSWQDGLHQAIETLEGLPIIAKKAAAAQITRQRFLRLYENLSGITETAFGCEQELDDVYQLPLEEIPLRVPSQRIMLPIRYFSTNAAKYDAIVRDIVFVLQLGRAVLVGTRSISDSESLADKLARDGIECRITYGLQDAAEAEVISRAGDPRAVTIVTNLAGRGTDIFLHPDVRANGGLHVIVAECQMTFRMDRQLIGRCARQGDPGSAQIYASAEDTLVSIHGPWLADALLQEADENTEIDADFTPQLRQLQVSAERQQCAARINMLRRDIARNSILRSV